MNKFLSFGLVLLSGATATAQEPADTVELDPLVVTATQTTLPVSRVTAAVAVINSAELRRRGIRTVAEALRTVSGATVVQTGSYGASTSLFLRGGESDYVQLLIDGVQVNSPGEQFNWSNLAIEDIDRIEIVKGPASVLYGSDAVTGVVQLFTKRHVGRRRGGVVLTGGRGAKVGAQSEGNFNNGYAHAELAGGTDRAGYSIGASYFGTDGAYAFNNTHRNTSVTARASLRADARSELSTSVRYSASRYHVPTDGTGQLTDRNQFQDAAALSLGADLTRQLSSRLHAQVDLQYNHNDATTDDRPDDAADTVGFHSFHSDERFTRQKAHVRVNYLAANSSTLTMGGEFEHQQNRAASASPFGDTPETTEGRSNSALYGQWLGDWSRIALQFGARAEDNEKFGNFATYRGGVAVKATSALRFRASGGTAFKQPRFFEQFAQGFVRGNPNLEPERSRNLEAGVDITWPRVSLTATYFDQKFKDLIQYVAITATPTDPNYMNVAGARASGVELGAVASLANVVLTTNYTMLDTRVTDEGNGDDPSFAEGESLLRRPEHSGSVGASVLHARGNLSATLHYVGKRADLDFASFPANRVILHAYTRMDAAGEVRLNNAVAATLKVENVFDKAYEEVLGFPAARRVIHAGARLTF